MSDEILRNENGCEVTYAAIRKAMNGESFHMSIVDADEEMAVVQAVNVGIDSHLEAISSSDFGGGERKVGDLVVCQTAEMEISVEDMPVLLRRLFDGDGLQNVPEDKEEDLWAASYRLGSDIMGVLGFDDCGNFVGRDD